MSAHPESAGRDVAHSSVMGSMDRVFGTDAVAEFVTALGGDVVMESKLDGRAVVASSATAA